MVHVIKLTVLFNDPFWIGIFEKKYENNLKVCKVTFGAEPKDYEVYEYILRNYNSLEFSETIFLENEKSYVEKKNPKRVLREIKKQTSQRGIGTKAQEALKLQYENNKEINKKNTKEFKELDKERKYYLKQKKRLEKHKGH